MTPQKFKVILRTDIPRDTFYLIDTRYWQASCPLCGNVCCPVKPCPRCGNVAVREREL